MSVLDVSEKSWLASCKISTCWEGRLWVFQVNMVDKPTQRNGFSSSAPAPGFVLLDFGFCDTGYFFLPYGSLLGGFFQISLSLSRGKYQKLMEP